MSSAGKLRDGRRHAAVWMHRGRCALSAWWRHLRRRTRVFFGRTPQWIWIGLLALGVGTAGFFLGHGAGGGKGGGGKGGEESAQKPPPAPPGPPTVTLDPQQLQYAGLQMGTAYQTTLPTPLKVLGTVAPNINGLAQVSPRLAGKLVRVVANVGQAVRAGQTIAVVSSPDLLQMQAQYQAAVLRQAAAAVVLQRQLQIARLGVYGRAALETARVDAASVQGEIANDQATVVSSQAQAAQAAAQVNLTQKEYVRAQLLYQAQLLSRQGLQQSEADAQAASAALETARAAAAASVDRLRNARNRGAITETALAKEAQLYRSGALAAVQVAPARNSFLLAAGEVRAAAADLRQLDAPIVSASSPESGLLPVVAPISGSVSARMASVGETVTPGSPLLTVVNLRTVIVQLNAYQEDVAHLRPGLPVSVVSNTAPGRNYSGVVSVIGTALDSATRTVPVYCAIRNPDGALRPGVYVGGTIYGAARAGVIAVPQIAVQVSDKGHVVFTPGAKPGVYVAQPVQVGETVHGMTQITQGLTSGQPVVTTNAFVLQSQMIKDTLD